MEENSHLALVGQITILKVKMEVIMILTTKESLLEQELNRCVNLANINGNMINVWYAQCVESVLVMETVVSESRQNRNPGMLYCSGDSGCLEYSVCRVCAGKVKMKLRVQDKMEQGLFQ